MTEGPATKYHLTAIAGTGMAAVAGLLKEAGHEVRGSDKGEIYPPMSDLLAELQIPVAAGYDPTNLDWGPDVVVIGNSCRKDHPELLAATERGLQTVSFPQLLGEVFLATRHSIVVAGTHGKTTTTSIVAQLLSGAGLEPGYLIGGIPQNFGKGFAVGQPPYFVVEGDEYDCACFDKRPKFVHYRPKTVILTGVEFDHVDIYPDMEAVRAAFAQLIERIPQDGRLIVAADSPEAVALARKAQCPVELYAVSADDDQDGATETRRLAMPLTWHGSYVSRSEGRTLLTVERDGKTLRSFDVPMRGAHNQANALAALAACLSVGVEADALATAISAFKGIARRQQIRGEVRGIRVIDDFAHHPTAVRETLKALKPDCPGRLFAVFEPRSATSRRAIFQQQYADALRYADAVFLAPVFGADALSEATLNLDQLCETITRHGVQVTRGDVATLVPEIASQAQAGDWIVVMSCGGFDQIHERLLSELES